MFDFYWRKWFEKEMATQENQQDDINEEKNFVELFF
jgi:hypothetical protein